jgi:hypothetical protein
VAHDILQRFLTAKLFDVSGDDTRLNRLRETAEDLAEQIKSAPSRTSAFVMVAIDAKVPHGEPVLAEVASLLEKRWNTYAGAFANETLPVVIRGIILEALGRIIGSEPIALAVALTARSLLPILGSPADRSLWADIVDDADRRLENRAGREWTMPSAASVQSLSLALPTVQQLSAPTLKRDYISERVAAAAGPEDHAGNGISNGNPYWPNQGQSWSNEFVPRATKAIGDSVDAVAKLIVDKINAQAPATALVEAINQYVGQVSAGLAQTTVGVERRTALLWWKEALYSPALKQSYRSLDLALVAGWLAVDAVEITGAFAPRMMEAFLIETFRSLNLEASKTMDAKHLFEPVATDQSPASVQLRERLSQAPMEAGKSPLAGLLGRAVPIDASFFEKRLGVPGSMKLSPLEFCVWLFRDLQITRAMEAKKRRGTK